MTETLTHGSASRKKWIALLGRRDTPTDGVEDYCIFLGRGLSAQKIDLERARFSCLGNGWIGALRQLWRESASWSGRWVLLQYTAFSWSRRGFPISALIVLAVLRHRGARLAVVFHEASRQGQGRRWIDRLRGTCQDWVIRRLDRVAEKSIFTAPLETVSWLPGGGTKAAFIPIGANIPERQKRCEPQTLSDEEKTVIVFGVTGAPQAAREVEKIAGILREASRKLPGLRLVAAGRGSAEAGDQLVKSLGEHDVPVVICGILPAEDVSREFQQADALLFVRGAITPQRGSVMAGIAAGIPIIGYRDGKAIGPLEEAGIEWSASPTCEDMSHALVRVLSDPTHWMDLHERNLAAQNNYFSWNRIAEQYKTALEK